MTDINTDSIRRRSTDEPHAVAETPRKTGAAELHALIEAMFFAYRDFTADPDRILNEIGFGRAHHRVLYFVSRNPGMRVADLLDILKITKQSLARVLRELIAEGYVEQRFAEADGRARLLHTTPRGRALIRRLAAPQLERLRGALAGLDTEGRAAVMRFLAAMATESGCAGPGADGVPLHNGQKTEADGPQKL